MPDDKSTSVGGRFQPGNKASTGRPKGARSKLGEQFIQALQNDFAEHGPAVIAKVRTERPHEYLKVVASILPKQLNVNVDPLGEMSDDELVAGIAALKALLSRSVSDHADGGDCKPLH